MNKYQKDTIAEGLDRIADAERFTKLSRSTIYQLMNRGELPYVKIGRCRRIPHRSLLKFVAKHLIDYAVVAANEEVQV